MASTTERQRRQKDRRPSDPTVIRIQLKDGRGHARWITADLSNATPSGIGVSLVSVLQPGSTVLVRGLSQRGDPNAERRANVRWCAETVTGHFRAGLEFPDVNSDSTEASPGRTDSSEDDHYEIMQLNPNADGETIDRVYRLMAQRYHPDNPRTGDSQMFIQLSEAYQVLSNPERRAQYDVRHQQTKQMRWQIFDQTHAPAGQEAEKRKRGGILDLLYAKTLQDPERGEMTIFELEDLLGCPREHLQSALWYLKGKGYIQRSDNNRYSITVEGFEEAERNPSSPVPASLQLSAPVVA